MQPVAARPAPRPARIAFFAWSTLLGTLAVLAATRGELGPRWLGSLVGAWCVVPTIGVFFPGLETYGPVVSHGPRGHRSVALTFGDGPHPTTTRRILALLATTNHRATFFVLRPPLGHTSITTTRDIRRAGMIVVGWSVRGLDGLRGRRPEAVVARVARA